MRCVSSGGVGGIGVGSGGVGGSGVGDGGVECLWLALEVSNMVKIGIVDAWKWQSVLIGGGGFSVIIKPPKLILCLAWV